MAWEAEGQTLPQPPQELSTHSAPQAPIGDGTKAQNVVEGVGPQTLKEEKPSAGCSSQTEDWLSKWNCMEQLDPM